MSNKKVINKIYIKKKDYLMHFEIQPEEKCINKIRKFKSKVGNKFHL